MTCSRFARASSSSRLERGQFGGQAGVAGGEGLAARRSVRCGGRLADAASARVVGVALADGHRFELLERRLQLFVRDLGRRLQLGQLLVRRPRLSDFCRRRERLQRVAAQVGDQFRAHRS